MYILALVFNFNDLTTLILKAIIFQSLFALLIVAQDLQSLVYRNLGEYETRSTADDGALAATRLGPVRDLQ